MAKNNQIKKVVNGEIADADDVNQIVESAGNEGGAIPYDPTTHQRDDDGNESLGSANYPWGDLFINENASLKEIVTSTATINASVIFKHLRKVSYMKDVYTTTPDSWVGHAGQALRVRLDELGIEPASTSNVQLFTSSGTYVVPADIHEVYVTMVGAGGGGGGSTGTTIPGGGGGGGGYLINKRVPVTPGASISVVVGVGGAGSANDAGDGGNGGDSSFGSIVCSGGNGGEQGSFDHDGGAGGGDAENFNASANVTTAARAGGRMVQKGGNGAAGDGGTGGGGGGATPFGDGGDGGEVLGPYDGNAPEQNTGAGGGGASGGGGSGSSGGDGADGIVIVMY